MRFFVGLYHLHHAQHFAACCISMNTIRKRKGDFVVRDWMLDSGAFTVLRTHGDFPEPPDVYAAAIRRWSRCGNLLAAVSQDWMCEPEMIERTGSSVAGHQRRTIDRYDETLAADLAGVYLMPVLQGWVVDDYVRHLRDYGSRIGPGAWVGVGSVCKRNRSAAQVAVVLEAIPRERPDLRLHGFGVKTTTLRDGSVRDRLSTADSMAWSYAAWKQGRGAHNWREAARFVHKIETMPVQLSHL